MKRILMLIAILGFLSVSATEVYAQNPRQTKKRKKAYKKQKKQRQDPYEYKGRTYKDEDGDGVSNLYDHCPHTPKERDYEVTSVGCPPDTDNDGLFDPDDKCPTEPGPHDNLGCPWGDKDKDGILDKDDKCPDTPGLAKWKGCADKDGDGVMDLDDKCPDTPGLIGLQGCPGAKEDTDGDGIFNDEDKCVLVPGVADNHGCPELKPEEKEALKHAFENLLFETNKDIIMESSYSSLNELATVMKNNSYLKLMLEGHTDDQGSDEDNLDLSKRRAKAVKNYLVAKEIAENRIVSEGYGETRPVATNETAEGRQKNRRVEMTLKY